MLVNRLVVQTDADTAAVELAEPSPGGLLMPNQPMMYAGRSFSVTQLPTVMHLVRDLCGCQVSLMPSKAMFDAPGGGDWLRKYFTIGEIPAEERRKLFALARDLLNSDYAGHRLTFQLFGSRRRSRTCWPSITTTTSVGRSMWWPGTPGSRTRCANESGTAEVHTPTQRLPFLFAER